MGGQQITGILLFIFLGLVTCAPYSGWNVMFVPGSLLTELERPAAAPL